MYKYITQVPGDITPLDLIFILAPGRKRGTIIERMVLSQLHATGEGFNRMNPIRSICIPDAILFCRRMKITLRSSWPPVAASKMLLNSYMSKGASTSRTSTYMVTRR